MEQSIDWYAYLDKLSDDEILEELHSYNEEELKKLCVRLVRGWAFSQKQSEIRNEQFYRELLKLLTI